MKCNVVFEYVYNTVLLDCLETWLGPWSSKFLDSQEWSLQGLSTQVWPIFTFLSGFVTFENNYFRVTAENLANENILRKVSKLLGGSIHNMRTVEVKRWLQIILWALFKDRIVKVRRKRISEIQYQTCRELSNFHHEDIKKQTYLAWVPHQSKLKIRSVNWIWTLTAGSWSLGVNIAEAGVQIPLSPKFSRPYFYCCIDSV